MSEIKYLDLAGLTEFKEELDRVLQPVEDEKVSKEIQDYKQNDDEDE